MATKSRIVPLWLAAIALAALACRAGAQSPTATPEPTSAPAETGEQLVLSGDYELNLTYEGESRDIIVHLPTGYDENASYPVVIVLHGGGGNAGQVQRGIRMDEAADARGFIVVYPNGSGPLEEVLFTWNTGHCCGYALEHRVDDVGFLSALIDNLMHVLPIDAGRVYMTGISNGAMMTYRFAAEMPEKIAAIAPVAGTIGGQAPDSNLTVVIPPPSGPVPLIAFHGLEDMQVPYQGGEGPESVEPGRIDLSVAESIGFWVAANGCNSEPSLEELADGNIRIETYSGCQDGADVVLVTVVDGGHAWPGGRGRLLGDNPTQDISASEMMLDFFLEH